MQTTAALRLGKSCGYIAQEPGWAAGWVWTALNNYLIHVYSERRSSPEVRNVWSYTSTSLYALMELATVSLVDKQV